MRRKRLPSGMLESQVLDALWARGAAMTPGEVHAVLRQGRPLAYTTVMTILVRLCEKGLVTRRRAGRSYAYEPTITREERAAKRMDEILRTSGDRTAALARFVERLTPDERKSLGASLRSRERRR